MHKIDLGGAPGAVDRVHLIGIGGISMSALAEILLRDGYAVSGSDELESDAVSHLCSLGVAVTIGNAAANITPDIDLVVHTAAVKPDNPEYRAASALGLPIIDRAALLKRIMKGYAYTVCVAGTHGKTGTTAMMADACLTAGLDPTIMLGGYMGEGYNFRVGQSPYFVMEACEYFDSFLQWNPYVGIILNIDEDHMDYFQSMERLIASFAQFARNIQPGGALIIYAGTPGFEEITRDLPCRVIAYGGENSEYVSRNMTFDEKGQPSFDVAENGRSLARVSLRLHGAHYALNALAVAAACRFLGLSPENTAAGLSSARGVKRRFEHKGLYNGAEIVDDYAHHPTEIMATLAAARGGHKGRIICAFQPHTYSRTQNLLEEFSHAFTDADLVLLLPIYASREAFDGKSENRITSRSLAEKIQNNGRDTRCAESFEEAERILRELLIPGDLLITMGAGDVYLVGERLLHT